MSEPKRRFWQLHLSTLVIVVIFAASFVGINARKRGDWTRMPQPTTATDEVSQLKSEIERFRWEIEHPWVYGWPCNIYPTAKIPMSMKGIPFDGSGYRIVSGYSIWAIVVDMIVLFSSSTVIAMILEWLIRRRETRKP